MKITKAQLKEIVRKVIKNRLDSFFLIEQFGGENLPEELKVKAKEAAEKYMANEARWFSLENLFWELEPYSSDPMEVVGYVYSELNKAAQGEFASVPSQRQKEKAQKAYYKLIDLATKARMVSAPEEE